MEHFSVFGNLIAKACWDREQRTGEHYSMYRLARETNIASSHFWRVCRGAAIGADLVNRLCDTLECDDAWREALLNAAGHASPRQQQQAARLIGEV